MKDHLSESFQEIITSVRTQIPFKRITAEQINHVLDLTCLVPEATNETILDLSLTATKHKTAAVCVYPDRLSALSLSYEGRRAIVVNFPTGRSKIDTVLGQIEATIENYKIDEIDYVFPYESYLRGNLNYSLAHCGEVIKYCLDNALTLKVILETGCFPSMQSIYDVSKNLLNLGCHFLKTSTGKVTIGATPEAVFSICKAICDGGFSAGVKCSGGIRALESAVIYVILAEQLFNRGVDASWFRIGSSKLF